jgi:hypothetical protein
MTLTREPVSAVSMTLPHKPTAGGEAHTNALERLDAAMEDQGRLGRECETARGGPSERNAAVAMAEANEVVAARKAWVHYIEHGY